MVVVTWQRITLIDILLFWLLFIASFFAGMHYGSIEALEKNQQIIYDYVDEVCPDARLIVSPNPEILKIGDLFGSFENNKDKDINRSETHG